jgi:hypothetical protein
LWLGKGNISKDNPIRCEKEKEREREREKEREREREEGR